MKKIIAVSGAAVAAFVLGCSKPSAPPTETVPPRPAAASTPTAGVRTADDCEHDETKATCRDAECTVTVEVRNGKRFVKPFHLHATANNPTIVWKMDPGSSFSDTSRHGIKPDKLDALTGGKATQGVPGEWKAKYISSKGTVKYTIKFDNGGDKTCDPTINNSPGD